MYGAVWEHGGQGAAKQLGLPFGSPCIQGYGIFRISVGANPNP